MTPACCLYNCRNRIIIRISQHKVFIISTNHNHQRIFPAIRQTSPQKLIIPQTSRQLHLSDLKRRL